MSVPFSQECINLMDSYGGNKIGVHTSDSWIYQYFMRYLTMRAMSVFKPTAPEHWNESYYMYVLFCNGFFAVINTSRYGIIPQHCTINGRNVQYMPSRALIANPLFRGNYDLEIGRQCAVIRLQPDYGGIGDVVAHYANMLSLAVESVNINFINSHLAYIFAVGKNSVAKSMEDMYSKISRGEPSVIIDSSLIKDGEPTWQKFDQDVKRTYIASDLLSDIRVIVSMFDEELGIPSNNNPKKERMIVDEVNSNNVATYSRMDMCLDQLKKDCKVARDLFGINLDFNWRYQPDIVGGGQNVQPGTSVGAGAV